MSTFRNGERILKKIECLSICKRAKRKEISQVVQELSAKYNLKELLKLSGIPKSTYYYYIGHREKDNKALEDEIALIHNEHPDYGYRRITIELNRKENHKNNRVNHKKILKTMRLLGIRPHYKGVSKYNSYKGEIGRIAPNLLLEKAINGKGKEYEMRNFRTCDMYKKIVTDISEFKVGDEKLYFSPTLDLYNGEILVYTYSTSPNLSLVKNMMNKLLDIIPKNNNTIFHSDQGWHYQHKTVQRMIKDHGMIQSMSRKGNCLDNSLMENFFGRMKCEMYYGFKYDNIEELKEAIDNYIYYYNNKRIKIKLNGLSPVEYRTQSIK